jgi:hypothetical protein
MSRQQFTNRNNINSVLTFQKSGSTASFDPNVLFGGGGSRRVSWKLDNGTNVTQTAGNSITYTGFTSDPGVRTIQMKGNSFRGITGLSLDNENLYGHIDLSGLNNWGVGGTTSLDLFTNPNLTGVTNPNITIPTLNNYRIQSTGFVGNLNMTPITGNIGVFNVSVNPTLTGITHNTTSRVTSSYTANNCNLTGNLNLPYTGMSGTFQVQVNPNLTGITHAPSSENISTYQANSCNLTGNLDLTPLSGLGGSFTVTANSGLTSITHSVSTRFFTQYTASSCKLTGNLDLTPLSGLGGVFQVHSNKLLTGITHSVSSRIFTNYYAYDCNLTGNLDLTPLSGLGNDFRVFSNSGLTSVTHSVSVNDFNVYWVANCNLIGNLDLTPLSGLGGEIIFNNNSNLTSITHSTSVRNIINYQGHNCNLTGTLDLSPLTKLGGVNSGVTVSVVRIYSNPNLTNIIFPNSTQFFKNLSNSSETRAFSLSNCNLDYVDFTPLSGATMVSGTTQGRATIELQNNNMSATDVNHILVDFSNIATSNHPRWSEVTLNISGTNAPPDSSSGGYDGLAAITTLTGSPYNWIIQTS